MDVDITLTSIAMTYIHHGCMETNELEGFKYLLKDSTDRRAIQVHNNGQWYDTTQDYFIRKDTVISMAKEIKVYVGKEIYKVDLDNLLSLEVETVDKITYTVAKKYEMFIDALEVTVEDCTGKPVNIVDEYTYKLAIAELVNIIISDKEEEVMSNTTNNEVTVNNTTMEESVMKDVEMREVTVDNATVEVVAVKPIKEEETNMMKEVGAMMDKAAQEVKESLMDKAEETAEEFADKADKGLEKLQGTLACALEVLDKGLGYTVLKDSILDIVAQGDLKTMASKCRELIDDEIENLEYWGDADSFKKAVQLKALVGDERGKSVFESFASGVIWIVNKVTNKLRQWFKVTDEKTVLNSVRRGLRMFVGLLRKGVSIAWGVTKFVVSYAVAGITKVGAFIVNTFKNLLKKVKEFAVKQCNKLESNNEDEFDFEVLDEEDDDSIYA